MRNNAKILIAVCLLGISLSSASASCLYEKKDPICSVSGKTYISSCEGWSDTSSWNDPIAYEGECSNDYELTDEQKDIIYDFMYNIFKQRDYLGNIYGIDDDQLETDDSLNLEGQNFINNNFFPAVKKYINKEKNKNKNNVNNKNIAILNYASSIVSYDYSLQK